MRKCTECGKEKQSSDFGKHKLGRDGLRPKCKECTRVYDAAYRAANADRAKLYRDQHRDDSRAYYKKWKIKNADRLRERSTIYVMNRRKTDPEYALVARLRRRIRSALSHKNRSDRFWDLTGCSRQQLFSHIENQFSDGMSWNNSSLWHVDHIMPCASFDLTDPAQQRRCFHYTNLQPLWARDNLAKGARIPHQEQAA